MAAAATEPILPDNVAEDVETTGAIPSTHSPLLDQDDDEDEEDVVTGRRTAAATNEDEDLNDDEPPLEDEDDLFGDGGDDEEVEQPDVRRTLDDEELDSGDDEGRRDRLGSAAAAEEEQQEVEQISQDLSLPRHAVPEPSDNEVYLMKVPRFLSVDPKSFALNRWQPPTTDHHSKIEPSPQFSAFKTAQTTIRWRHSPSDPSKLQSNARVLRWSDGSLTLQLGSDPTTQYEIDGKPLAPPQHNPLKPTPTSVRDRRGGHPAYDPSKDSFTYLCSPNPSQQAMRITHKVTAGLSVLPAKETTDDALERLQESLAAAAKARSGTGATVFSLHEDPEKKKRQAEAAEKEKDRAAKAAERAATRRREKEDRALGRSGLRTMGYGGGLTIGGLEDEDRPARGARTQKPIRRSRHDWSDEEDYGPRRGTREDEYDEEDDFIAGSDEEPEIVEDDDEDIDEGIEEERPRRRDSPKRRASEAADEDDEDEEVITTSRTKRRRVVEEDDDDDDEE